ncbi:MAG: ABC transporter ATP-binding protein [Acidimicrobiia bacterium]
MSTDALVVNALQAGYGRVPVVFDVSFSVEPGEMVALVGRNGAGKTTSLMAAAGLRYGMNGGTVSLGGVDLSKATPDDVVRTGLKLVPEGRRLFREMTVLQNLKLGAFTRRHEVRSSIDSELADIYELFPALAVARDKVAGALSGGQQQMVAIGQAMLSKPKFLILDEPTAGLAPALIDDMYDSFNALVQSGIGILIVDQNIQRVLDSASRYYVVESGRTALDGVTDSSALERVTRIVLGSDRQRQESLDSI